MSSFPLLYNLYFSLSYALVLVEVAEISPGEEGQIYGECGGRGACQRDSDLFTSEPAVSRSTSGILIFVTPL
jgi:hypothetical protein